MTRRILLVVVIIIIGIQLYRPARTNPPEDSAKTIAANTTMPPQVHEIITHSCSDCHSYKTVWPWYSKVAPVSWFVTSDVNDGRRHLNLSDWAQYKPERQQKKLSEICDEVEEGGMPLRQYTWMHAGTQLSDTQRQQVCAWTKAEQTRITSATGVAVPAERQGGMRAAESK